ncbi:MAG: hypothetical protein QOH57_4173 [Mycobacterium sp.]|nr:hypothetical protein [Mycobacterium sp.]
MGMMPQVAEPLAPDSLPFLATGELIVAPRVNLLPPEIALQRELQKLAVALVGAVLVCVGLVGLLYLHASGSEGAAKTKVDAATAIGAGLSQQVTALSKVQVAQTNLLATRQTLTQAMGTEILYSKYFDQLRSQLPDGMRFSSVAFTPAGGAGGAGAASAASTPSGPAASAVTSPGGVGSLSISGKARSADLIATWLEKLPQIKGFADSYLTTDSVDEQTGLHTFTVTVTLTPDALSKRFANGG